MKLLDQFKFEVPPYATWGGWRKWHAKTKQDYPIGYFFRYTLRDIVVGAISEFFRPLSDLRIYVRQRFVERTHIIDTGLKPGGWYEFDDRILHASFNMLVDFVEIETAWHHVICDSEARKKYAMPWYTQLPYFLRWKKWRNAEAGVAHLDWAASLTFDEDWVDKTDEKFGTPTPQAIAAAKTKQLYLWWKSRPENNHYVEASNLYNTDMFWDKIQDKHPELDRKDLMFEEDILTKEEKEERKKLMTAIYEHEQKLHETDNEMLIELIKIRRSLWT